MYSTLSTPPSKPERKKRPAPSPTSRDQVSEVKNEVKDIDRSKSMNVTDGVTEVTDVPRDRPITTWQPNEHPQVVSYGSQGYSSQGDTTNSTTVNIAPPRMKRQAPAPPPAGQLGPTAKQHEGILYKSVCLLLNGTSALFRPLMPRINEIKPMRYIKHEAYSRLVRT